MFGSIKSLKACTAHISHWLICHEIRNEEGVNVSCLSVLGLPIKKSVLGLFGFRNVTYTTFLFTCINILLVKSKVKTWRKMQRGPIN